MNDLPTEARFGVLLIRVARAWRREADHALATTGLSEATALPLLVLSHSSGENIRQGMLAECMGVEGPSLVRLIDLLEAEGQVMRREDPTDRRAKTLHLTEKGRETAAKIEAVMRVVRRRLVAEIAAEDLKTAAHVLEMLERRLFPADETEHH